MSSLYQYPSADLELLLEKSFDEEWLITFCYDYFKPIYDRFKPEQTYQERLAMIRQLASTEQLLRAIAQQMPTVYARYKPAKQMTFQGKQTLIKALLECSAISDPGRRNTLINSLPSGLQQTVTRSLVALDEVTNLVNTCEQHNAFADLLEVLTFFEQNSQSSQRVEALLRL